MKVAANTLRKGNVIEYENKLWVVVKNDLLSPGKGAAVAQIEMRDVRSGIKNNVRFRTQETIEQVRLEQEEYQYLYPEDNKYVFMHTVSFEQKHVNADIVGEPARFLQEGMICEIETYEGDPLNVTLPETVVLEIVEADPVIKGQTATTSYKPAVLSNGAKIMVPPHVSSGIRVIIKTEDGSYVERAKD
jgi:elongation factor P